MKNCLVIISLILSHWLSAQKGNTFTVGLSSGIGMTKSKTIGETKPLDNRSNIHTALNVNYCIKLPKILSFDLNFGLENISYFPYPENIGRSSGSTLLSNLGAGLNYKIPLTKNFFYLGINGGVRFIGNVESSYSTNSQQSYSKTIYTFEKSTIPFMALKLGYEFPLKNKNLLGIDLSIMGSFRPIYSMEYNFSNFVSFSNGTYSYSGNSVHLGIHYTWTKNKKNAEIQTLILDSIDRKEAKKLVAINNRFQSSKAVLIQLHQGGFMNQSKIMNHTANIFKNASGPSSSMRLNASIGWKNNWSFQPGVSIDSYWIWIRDQQYGKGLSGSNLFNLFTLDLGMKRRMLSFPKTNRYLCNVHGGISFSYLNGSGGGSGSSISYSPTNSNQVLLTYNYSYQYSNKVFPTAFVGVSKDLRLSQHLLFTIAYRHQFGLSRGMIIPFSYTVTNQAPVSTQIRVNGNANCISLGLAYRFNNK
jgi:hypothetical protein